MCNLLCSNDEYNHLQDQKELNFFHQCLMKLDLTLNKHQ